MYKICFVATTSITLKTFVLKFAEYLHRTGDFEISFVCSNDEEFSYSLPEYIRYIPVKMSRGVSFDGIAATIELIKLFRREKFDMVQYSTPNASLYASIASRLAKVPVRLYCQWGIVYVGFEGVKRKIFKMLEKLICINSTIVEPDSNGNREFCIKERLYTYEKSRVIWNGSASGVDFDKFNIDKKDEYRKQIRENLKIPPNAFVYAFVGRITRDKGINELFAAAKNIIERTCHTYLILVGNNEAGADIDQELLGWATLSDRVLFCGYTNEVEKYLAG